MAAVRNVNTKEELTVRHFLHKSGLRYRTNVNTLPGKPDIVLRKYQTVIFIHGCFWHGHTSCPKGRLPKSNKEFWYKKINGNIIRDQKNIAELERHGWHVIVVWSCMINDTFLMQLTQTIINKANLM